LYTCRLSTLMISVLSFNAKSMAAAVLPEAVGPPTTIRVGLFVNLNYFKSSASMPLLRPLNPNSS
jgi:hypothetical protein